MGVGSCGHQVKSSDADRATRLQLKLLQTATCDLVQRRFSVRARRLGDTGAGKEMEHFCQRSQQYDFICVFSQCQATSTQESRKDSSLLVSVHTAQVVVRSAWP